MAQEQEILAIVETGLQRIALPPLIRPPVSEDNPNEVLVLWGIRYYSYSVIAHSRTVLRGLVRLINDGNIPTALIVSRHVFEWAAHTCYLNRNTKNYVERREWRRAWHLHSLAMQGNRWIKDHGSKYDPTLVTNGIPDPLSVPNIVAGYEEYRRQRFGVSDARDTYGLLSEHSHQNAACFHPYCKYFGPEVRFVAPSPDTSLLAEKRCLIDLVLALEALLRLARERVVCKQLVAILKELASLAKDKK
jgi:hypothetical protein